MKDYSPLKAIVMDGLMSVVEELVIEIVKRNADKLNIGSSVANDRYGKYVNRKEGIELLGLSKNDFDAAVKHGLIQRRQCPERKSPVFLRSEIERVKLQHYHGELNGH